MGDWPLTNKPVEAKIWLFGSSEGVKQVLAAANVGKEITVSLSTLASAGRGISANCFCLFSPVSPVSPSPGNPVSLLVGGAERKADLHSAGRNVGAAPQAEPPPLPPRTLPEEHGIRVVNKPTWDT